METEKGTSDVIDLGARLFPVLATPQYIIMSRRLSRLSRRYGCSRCGRANKKM